MPDFDAKARELCPDRPEHDPRWTRAVRGMIADALRASYVAAGRRGYEVGYADAVAQALSVRYAEQARERRDALKSKNGGE